MKDSKRMEPLIKLAERIKTDQTIPKKWARKLLVVNRGFQRELRKHFQATEILKGSKKLLENVKNGKMTMEEYQLKIIRASQQVEGTESFFQELQKISGVTL